MQFLTDKALGQEFIALKKSVGARDDVNVLSVTDSLRPHVAGMMGRFVLYIARDRLHADQVKRWFDALGKRSVVLKGKDDFLIYRRSNVSVARVEALAAMNDRLEGKGDENALDCLIISPEVLMQYLTTPKLFSDFTLRLKKEMELDTYSAADALTMAGYVRVDKVSAAGEFAIRGDILDIYPVAAMPIRVNFFGDWVESIKVIDPESMMGIRSLDKTNIYPATEIILCESQIPEIIERIKDISQSAIKGVDRVRLKSITEDAIERLETRRGLSGFDWIMPFAPESFATIFDWLPKNSLVVYDEPKIIHERIQGYYTEFYERVAQLLKSGEVYPVHFDAVVSKDTEPPSSHTKLAYLSISNINPFFMPEQTYKIPSQKAAASYHIDPEVLISDLRSFLRSGKTVVLCAKNAARAKAIYDNLKTELRAVSLEVEKPKDEYVLPLSMSHVMVTDLKVLNGFHIEKANLIVIGTEELLGKEQRVLSTKKRTKSDYVPQVGDFVVHEVHGIGKFIGIEKLSLAGFSRDYGRLAYRGDDSLLIPVENLDRLVKYSGGGEPRLSKMGGVEFAKVKESVKSSVKKLAIDLFELYGLREKGQGFKYAKDTEWQKQFEDAFEFDETIDQLTAIEDIKKDLESGKIMDRLLCGDVGYGKTEVAFRACFKVVMEGKQAAILAPTTLLAKQHYNTLAARAADFGLNIARLTRFETQAEVRRILGDLSTGKLNIIVATHRLMSKDIEFHDLGLLVLDEEQRFGVEHKEKIKTIKNNVNVLTMTATPIPRTLHMSLSGIRDISLLDTPPKNRIPVETYVTEYSEGLVRDAILREKGRGGQTFILYNYVETIDSFAYKVANLFSEQEGVKIVTAHGRMTSTKLDERMTAFYDGKADVLICTTIIENGIDLPSANTIIVIDSDRLGLASLYQLRGRVGRSGQVAHAYMTYKSNKIMTENAMKRLNAVMDYTDFGSGYKLAMRDLEIRGAGNLLGAEQHGHMEKVGYEMYSRMLKKAVGELREDLVEGRDVPEVETRIDAEFDMYLDDKYVAGEQKTQVYSKIAAVDTFDKKDELIEQLTEVYGKPPIPVVNLIDAAILKNAAAKVGALRAVVKQNQTAIYFDNNLTTQEHLLKKIAKDRTKTVKLAGRPQAPILNFNITGTTNRKIKVIVEFLKQGSGE